MKKFIKSVNKYNIMLKKSYDDDIISEHGSWNVAADYARLKIMKQLYLADEYEIISTFGFSDFIEELENMNIPIDVLRIRGFKRLIKCLIMVINNAKFAVKGSHKETLVKFKDELKRYWKVISTLFKYRHNQQSKTKELVLNEDEYNEALERVIEIKSEINEPLNRYDLIFTHKEEFDPKKAKEMIKKELKEKG